MAGPFPDPVGIWTTNLGRLFGDCDSFHCFQKDAELIVLKRFQGHGRRLDQLLLFDLCVLGRHRERGREMENAKERDLQISSFVRPFLFFSPSFRGPAIFCIFWLKGEACRLDLRNLQQCIDLGRLQMIEKCFAEFPVRDGIRPGKGVEDTRQCVSLK